MLYYFLFAKNVHFSLYLQQSEENRQLYPKAPAYSISVGSVTLLGKFMTANHFWIHGSCILLRRSCSTNGCGLEGCQEKCHTSLHISFALPRPSAPAGDTIQVWHVMTLLSSCSISGMHRQLLFSLSDPFHTHTHTHTELSCTHCPAPGRWLSVDSEISASQVLLRTLHELIVLNGAFCCA